MRRKKRECRSIGCHEEPYLGGLCKEHHEEDRKKCALRDAAVHVLHTELIDGQFLERPELREDLGKIRKWWLRACDAVIYERQDPVLMDEAPYAAEWCIRLAEQIVEAERALKSGANPAAALELTKKWVWERFKNLEGGLRSNGLRRPE